MIRKVTKADKEQYVSMSRDFYQSDAVLHVVPDRNIRKTFELITSGSAFGDGYIIEHEGKVAGYLLVSFAYSNEAGGMVLWLEEIYVKPEFQGLGLGQELLNFIDEKYKDKVVRIRLEVEESNDQAIQLYKKLGFENLNYSQMYKQI